jgi:hypothetical protein
MKSGSWIFLKGKKIFSLANKNFFGPNPIFPAFGREVCYGLTLSNVILLANQT